MRLTIGSWRNWASCWQIGIRLNGQIVTPFNPNASDRRRRIGLRWVDFVCNRGTTAHSVHNDFPWGDPRTIGYWKNWNFCTGGKQDENAAANGGPAAGFFILDNILPPPWRA